MYKELNADELYEVFHKTAMQLSYFNAAESSWGAEVFQRNACKSIYQNICQEYKDRGLDIPKGNYLI